MFREQDLRKEGERQACRDYMRNSRLSDNMLGEIDSLVWCTTNPVLDSTLSHCGPANEICALGRAGRGVEGTVGFEHGGS